MRLTDHWRRSDRDDWSRAMAAAAEAAMDRRDEKIELPCEQLRFYRPVVFGSGTTLVGAGGCPSNVDQGTACIACFNGGSLFTWRGDKPYWGSGGGIRDAIILAGKDCRPRCALRLQAQSPEQRAGKTLIFNTTITVDSSYGRFARGIWIDGTAVTTPGSAGTRTTWLLAVRVDGCDEYSLLIDGGTHVYGNVEVNPVGGPGRVLVMGKSENVQLGGMIYGPWEVDEGCQDVVLLGLASTHRLPKTGRRVIALFPPVEA